MSILNILKYPDIRLRKIAKPVKRINDNIKTIIKDMFETMYAKEGIGLAATQVNIHLQIIVISSINNNAPFVLINPTIIKKYGKIYTEEGCLSIPKITGIVPRSNRIHINALNINGKQCQIVAKSLLSICIQHEIDHLLGKLFIDYTSKIKKYETYKI